MRTVLVLLLTLLPVAAQSDEEEHDYERAREAVEQGAVLPLGDILPRVEERLGARVIEVEFEREDGAYVYEFELITGDGRIMEVVVDAATGEPIAVEDEDEDD